MRTLLEAILNRCEVTLEDAKLTVKEAVLQEDDTAKCIKTSTGYSIRSGKTRYGKGKTEEFAWENAILNLLEIG
jgi:deoxyribose-phosphate aldolase